MSRAVLALVAVGAALVGACTAVVATFDSRIVLRSAIDVPVGLAASVLATLLVVALPGLITGSRPVTSGAALGWFVGFGSLLLGNPGGDVVVSNDWLGYGWLFLGSSAAVGAWVFPTRRRRRPVNRRAPEQPATDAPGAPDSDRGARPG